MGRQAENSTTLPDGRRVGYGLIPPKQRSGYWRIRFRHNGRRVELSTGAETKGEARNRADALIREAFLPAVARQVDMVWDEAVAELATIPHLRPATVTSYQKAVRAFRKVIPNSTGPGDVTPEVASLFARKYRPKSANTSRNILRLLSSMWRKHFRALGIATTNPWADVPSPQPVKTAPRAPTDQEVDDFMAYLEKRYPGWDLIKLFVQVKGYLGCRTMDLCLVKSVQLYDGRLHFLPDQTKGRAGRSVPLLPETYAALDRLKGKTYLWEKYAEDAKVFRPHRSGLPKPDDYDPSALYWAVADIFRKFNESRPGKPRFRPHDLRRLALTLAAVQFGADRAARAIGVDPQTARRYYIDADRAANADAVYGMLAERWRYGGGEKEGQG